MFILHVMQLLGLTALFVQTFLAWIFVAGFAALREEGWSVGPYRNFQRAFLALATALTIVSVRFYQGHMIPSNEPGLYGWGDGDPSVVVCYAAYMGLKAAFAMWLLAGTFHIRGVEPPRTLWSFGIATIVLATAAPLAFPNINDLLIIQAPIMIGCAVVALRNLAGQLSSGTGIRIVRWSLVGLAITWTIHAGAAATREYWEAKYILSFNSFLDMGVQLGLGLGLVATLLQETHRRLAAAEQDRETLTRSIDQDDKLRVTPRNCNSRPPTTRKPRPSWSRRNVVAASYATCPRSQVSPSIRAATWNSSPSPGVSSAGSPRKRTASTCASWSSRWAL